jgi:beta-galactosidase
MSRQIGFLILIVLICANAAVVSAQGRSGRVTTNFDADWLFYKGDAEGAEKPDFADSAWRKLNVPHDWSIEGPFDKTNPTRGSGGFLPAGIGWYRKHFTVASADAAKNFSIEFDGVMANSDVWINGFHLGKRPYGYISFGYDLTLYLHYGRDNVIAVRADNSPQPASRWYTGAGIYRHVRLISTDPIHIEKWGAFVTTPQVNDKEATVNISANILNQTSESSNVSARIEILDPSGKVVGRSETKASAIGAGLSSGYVNEIKIENPKLWNLESPFLYQAVVKVVSANKVLDSETVTFGIRDAHFEPATGFWLNGKNFKIKGACLHHDGSAFGAAVPLAVWERRLTALRELGVNAIRTAHNPPAPEFLDLADRMGFLVMDENFDQWTVAKNPYDYHLYFNEWNKIDTRDMVLRDRNHPSVIIYSAGNEIHDTPKPEIAKPILAGLVETFHKYDPTRPVTQALFRPNVSHDYEDGLADLLDVVGQNYREKEILAAYKQNPKRKILGTENTHDINQWIAMRDNPEYSGQFIWVGVDYLGEAFTWPNYAYSKGLLDRTAQPRPIGAQRQSWWSEKPMVYISRRVAPTEKSPTDPGYEAAEQRRTQVLFSDWTPKDLTAHDENVEVYSNCEGVELFLNGKSLGKKSMPKDASPLNWNVGFEAGTIRAIGYNNGKAVSNFELRTAGKPARITLSPDKTSVANSWDDVVFVKAEIVDEYGVIVPTANDMVKFDVSGGGVLAVVDSADNTDTDLFQTTQRKAFQGRVFAMIKARSNSGTIKVFAQAGNLKSGTISLKATR